LNQKAVLNEQLFFALYLIIAIFHHSFTKIMCDGLLPNPLKFHQLFCNFLQTYKLEIT